MKEANDTMSSAKSIHERCQKQFNTTNERATTTMDILGKTELETLKSFETFSNLIEKIQNRPDFKEINRNGVSLPEFNAEKLKEVYVGAGVLLGGLGGAAAGTFGGFAAAGATTAAVMALGTASTGTAIASLGGVAATNATLAALGGGALAAGGGGMALGSAVLGGATLGVGLLVGGIIFNVTGSKLSDKADEAWRQAKKEEEQVNKICSYLGSLISNADSFCNSILEVRVKYKEHIGDLNYIINTQGKTDWNEFSDIEKRTVENTYMLVAVLYKMCKVQLVLKSDNENDTNKVNVAEIDSAKRDAETVLAQVA
jgi:hypothetical protein